MWTKIECLIDPIYVLISILFKSEKGAKDCFVVIDKYHSRKYYSELALKYSIDYSDPFSQ